MERTGPCHEEWDDEACDLGFDLGGRLARGRSGGRGRGARHHHAPGAPLRRAKRAGLGEYGVFAQRYVREFDAKWLRGGRDPGEPLSGSADIQSLADLGNSFEVIRTMRIVPFSKETVFQLGVATLAPLLPLLLTMISFEELLKRLLGAVF